jgi:hypothetical protein
MRVFRHTIWIARTPEEVFDFFLDFSQAPRWRSHVRTMATVGGGPVRAGSRVHVTMDVLGDPYEIDLQVLAVERPTLWRHRTDETDFNGHIEYRFDADSAGTLVSMTMEVRPISLHGWLALPLMWLRRRKIYVEQLPNLKRAIEGGTS